MSILRSSCVCLALLGGAAGITLTVGLAARSGRADPPAAAPSRPSLALRPARPAQPAEGTAAASAVAELPDDVDLVVVVENGAELRTTPLGEAAARFLGESGVLEDLSKAWAGLATQLGWTREEAFDRLLGKRVVLVSKSLGAADRRWAVLSDVTVETEMRLKEKLQAAPRAIDQGHQILSLENGEYELTSHHRETQLPRGQVKAYQKLSPADRVTIVLGPTGKGELFDQIVTTLSGAPVGTGTLGTRDVFKQACGAGPAEVLVLAAFEPRNEAGDRWKDFFMLAGHRATPDTGGVQPSPGASWSSRVVVRQTARREQLLKIEPTDDGAFRALRDGSVFSMIQNVSLTDVLGEHAPFGGLLSKFPLPDEAKKEIGVRQAITVRRTAPGERVSCTIASRTDHTERVARTLDGPLARWLANLEKQCGVEGARPHDYQGIAPNAVRVAPIAASENGSLAALSSRPVVVSWAYPSRVVGATKPDTGPVGAPAGAAGDRPGWWVMNVSQAASPPSAGGDGTAGPTAAELLRADANALLGAGDPGETARWVWLVSSRPAALESMLPSILPDYNGFRSGLRRFEAVDLRLRITDEGDIQGDLDLHLAPTPQ